MKFPRAAGKLCTLLAAAFLAPLLSGFAVEYEADICVYGGTSGGVTAAVQAAKMGKKVALVEYGGHLGGMTSSGLGWTDFGNKASIGGLSLDFYTRIAKKYHSSSAQLYTFEPKVAEAVFNDMVQEADVPVYPNERLASVQMTGNRITSMTMENGDVFRAKMFIDCTYEGDLMARAGVSYAVGREPNSQYGETINGIQPSQGNDLPSGIDPDVVPGDPSSGLLPGVNATAGGADGDGDARVQAYNYRLCLTTRASNRVMITKPPGYKESDYELLFRAIAAGQTTGFLKNSDIGNGKTDTNNNGGISTDLISDIAAEWAEASYARRDEIAKAHELWIRGLIWTLQNSPRVSSSIRSAYSQWGLAADEFTDNDNWPYQLYVREARRMVSDYVMTELNCRGSRVAPESVALASYRMDSHSTQRYVSNGMVKTEGNVGIVPIQPYPISYRSIIPKTGECENLLVTFALSASHMGFASCRMEPVLMMLGQSAATAAAFAIDDQVSVQEVGYPKLKAQLQSDGQILAWAPGVSVNGIVVDNADTDQVELTGEWLTSSSTSGYYGANYLHDNNDGKGQKSVRFRPALGAGTYEVFGRWTKHENRATNVPVDIVHAGGTTTVVVNQKNTGGEWISLGTFPFAAGTDGSVVVRNTGTNGYVTADAFEFVQTSALPVVSIWASDGSASEPVDGGSPKTGTVTLSRTGETSAALTVQLSLQGTATNGIDFANLPALLTFPAGASIATMTVTPIEDAEIEGQETVTVSLAPGSGYQADPELPSATVRIRDRTPTPTPTPTPGLTLHPTLDVQPNGLTLHWQTEPGTNYRIRRSPDLKNWETIETGFNGTGEDGEFHESFNVWPRAMFYSIETEP